MSYLIDVCDYCLIFKQYRARDKPWYTLGHGIVLAYIGIGFICALVFLFFLRRENAKRMNGERDEIIVGVNDEKNELNPKNGRYNSIEDAKRDKGDEWSGYRYTL